MIKTIATLEIGDLFETLIEDGHVWEVIRGIDGAEGRYIAINEEGTARHVERGEIKTFTKN